MPFNKVAYSKVVSSYKTITKQTLFNLRMDNQARAHVYAFYTQVEYAYFRELEVFLKINLHFSLFSCL